MKSGAEVPSLERFSLALGMADGAGTLEKQKEHLFSVPVMRDGAEYLKE